MIAIWIFTLLAAAGACIGLYIMFRPSLASVNALWVVAIAVVIVAIGGFSYPIAHHIAQRSAIGGFHQWLNGSIVDSGTETISCTRDGPCHHEYDCDLYFVTVVDQAAYTDKDGNYHAEQSHQEPRWHDCPYATKEYVYTLDDSLGNTYTLGDHVFAAKPKRWRGGEDIPDNVFRGVPERWTIAVNNLKAGNADPVTVEATYDNYILADEDTLLRAYSDKIKELQKAKLLPDHTAHLKDAIHDYYVADKVSFVGVSGLDQDEWQSTLMHFNAALGMELRGDMHVVIIRASAIPSDVSPEDYANALKAYWLNDLGKYALAKNGIMLVLAVNDDGKTIAWSKADTGMPVGNGAMLQALSLQLNGQTLSTDVLFGDTTAQVSKDKVSYTLGDGLVTDIVFNRFPFERACMVCDDKDDHGTGFVNLSTDIPLGTWGTIWTIVIDLVLMCLVTYGGLVLVSSNQMNDESSPTREEQPLTHDRYRRFRRYDESPLTHNQFRRFRRFNDPF